jgi:hypothetical protein
MEQRVPSQPAERALTRGAPRPFGAAGWVRLPRLGTGADGAPQHRPRRPRGPSDWHSVRDAATHVVGRPRVGGVEGRRHALRDAVHVARRGTEARLLGERVRLGRRHADGASLGLVRAPRRRPVLADSCQPSAPPRPRRAAHAWRRLRCGPTRPWTRRLWTCARSWMRWTTASRWARSRRRWSGGCWTTCCSRPRATKRCASARSRSNTQARRCRGPWRHSRRRTRASCARTTRCVRAGSGR